MLGFFAAVENRRHIELGEASIQCCRGFKAKGGGFARTHGRLFHFRGTFFGIFGNADQVIGIGIGVHH